MTKPFTYFITICSLLTITFKCHGQIFLNPDLDGTIGVSVWPTNWTNIPYGDPTCQAYISPGATPDVTGLTGPVPSLGIIGNPYSGTTFVSGLMAGGPGALYHEGIMQTVSGLVPGNNYSITFYQTVVKQDLMLDQTGSWAVYIDNSLAGITAITTSTEPFNSVSLVWEQRTITFTASSASHTIKFLPQDDDADQALSATNVNGGLRMGIDHINIDSCAFGNCEIALTIPNIFTPNQDGINDYFIPTKITGINSMHTEIYTRWGEKIFNSDKLKIEWDGFLNNGKPASDGTYYWIINYSDKGESKLSESGYIVLIR
jgi:gliding motility-associated-like protein